MKATNLIVGLNVAYLLVAAAILFGLVYWSPQPLIDRVEAADPSSIVRGAVDFFEHTPRVEALLAHEESGGYTTAEIDRDRIRYGVGHLLLLLALGIDLLLIAAVAWIMPDPPSLRATAKTRNVPLGLAILGATVLGLLLAIYYGALTTARHSSRPSDRILVLLFPAQLMLMVLTLYVVDRLKRRKGGDPVVSRR